MQEMIADLFPLSIAIAVNMALGIYRKIGTEHMAWSWKKFFQGMGKAVIVGGAFLGLAYVFESTALSDTGITPSMIMTAAIVLYAVKGCKNLAGILGVQTERI